MTKFDERDVANLGNKTASWRAEDVAASIAFRKAYEEMPNVVKSEDMPFERSADGLIKHLVHHNMKTRELCCEAYMQFLKGSEKSGKHRHMWEEVIFVAEGKGYDLHWDCQFDCDDKFEWRWDETPKKFEWQRGDFIYIPPFVTHQHFNASPDQPARLIVISNRIIKEMGFDWFEQVERAEGF